MRRIRFKSRLILGFSPWGDYGKMPLAVETSISLETAKTNAALLISRL